MIVITGGAGFIGSVLARELNKMGREDLIIVDQLKDSIKWKNLAEISYLEYFDSDDFLDEDDFADLEIDAVFHMGACSSTTEMDMDYLMKNNVNYSKYLYGFCTQKNIPFIYASSAATYGNGELGYNDDHDQLKQLRPLNPYGYSKSLFDQWVLRQGHRPPKCFGLKFFNVFGPNEYHKEEMRSLVHKAFEQINESGKVKLFKSHRDDFEDGKQLRDFVYVKDVVRAMIDLWQNAPESKSGIYNMGTGQARSFYDLVSATFKAMDKKANIEFIDMPLSIRNQYQYYTKANMDKFYSVLPDFKFTSLEDAVSDYVTNHLLKENPHV